MRKTVLAVIAAALVLSAVFLKPDWAHRYFDPREFSLILVYTVVLVLARFSPGRCMYRLIVLGRPEKHFPPQVAEAQRFAGFIRTRVLFAGLIFTLAKIACVMVSGPDVLAASGALAMTLTSALYALVLYWVISRLWSEPVPAGA